MMKAAEPCTRQTSAAIGGLRSMGHRPGVSFSKNKHIYKIIYSGFLKGVQNGFRTKENKWSGRRDLNPDLLHPNQAVSLCVEPRGSPQLQKRLQPFSRRQENGPI
jgi:hypothetical protein